MSSNAIFAQMMQNEITKANYLQAIQERLNVLFDTVSDSSRSIDAIDCRVDNGRVVILAEISFDPYAAPKPE